MDELTEAALFPGVDATGLLAIAADVTPAVAPAVAEFAINCVAAAELIPKEGVAVDAATNAVVAALASFQPTHCQGFFRHAQYVSI